MTPPPPFSGAVLTGGASRRMGRDKALVEVGGRPLASGVAQVLWEAGAAEVFAVGGALGALEALGLDGIPDGHPGQGPLGGLLSALAHASQPVVAVLACDLPGARPEVVRLVVAALGAGRGPACAVPVVDGRLEPLHGAWRRSALPEIRRAFDRGERSVRAVVAELAGAKVEGIDPAAVADVDTPAQLAVAEPGPSI